MGTVITQYKVSSIDVHTTIKSLNNVEFFTFDMKHSYHLPSSWWGGTDPPHPEKDYYSLMVGTEHVMNKKESKKIMEKHV